MTYIATSKHIRPLSRQNEIHNFGRPFFSHYIALHVICLNHALVKTKRGEEILRVHDMTTPQHKNPCIEGDSIYNFCRLFPDHHYYTLSLSDLCLSEEKKILKEIMHFHYIWPRSCIRTPAPGS